MERCQDLRCGNENRLEYCEQDARDPEGDAGYVLQAIDEMLYENDQASSEELSYHFEKSDLIVRRTFSVTHFDSHTWILPLTKSKLAITHQKYRQFGYEVYDLTLSWAIERLEDSPPNEAFQVNYGVSLYRGGIVDATIEQPDFETGGRSKAQLTAYDYGQLYEVLDLFKKAQKAEVLDNDRAAA